MEKNFESNEEFSDKENRKDISVKSRPMPQKRNLTGTFKIRIVDSFGDKSAKNVSSLKFEQSLS